MTDVRQELIAAGWKQGVILKPGPFLHQEAVGFLVLNQTCDCINPCFKREPHLELLPLTPRKTKKGKPDPNYQDGKNPREIHFWGEVGNEEKCLVAKISEIELFGRGRYSELEFSNSLKISKDTIDDLLVWRANRYLRAAFPDSFEDAFRPLKEGFTALLTNERIDGLIDSILIQLDHYEELNDNDDGYELQLRLMVTPEVVGQPTDMEKLKALSQSLADLLKSSSAFFEPSCEVVELEKMNLWEARNFLDFTRYDYLSFGEN